MNLPILSYEGVGPIKFGMTQDEVRIAVGTEYKSFVKSPYSKMPTDNFVGKGIHVYYKPSGFCEAVEMFSPANPTFRGYRLMGLPFSGLLDYFKKEDTQIKIDSLGLTSDLLGIGLYVPDLDESDESAIKGVIVFEKGYYDS